MVSLSTAAPATGPADSLLREGIQLFRRAYNEWNPVVFKKAESLFDRAGKANAADCRPFYWKGVVNFHLVNYTLFGTEEVRDKKAGKGHVDAALKALEKALECDSLDAESHGLAGTLYGIKIFLKPYYAPILGPKVFSTVTRGTELAPENPRVFYLIGVSYIFTPRLMGGGVDKGLAYLLKSEKFYEKENSLDNSTLSPRWGHSTCLGFIGKAYFKKKQYHLAKAYFKKALAVNPKDLLAKSGLKDLKKMKKD